MMVSLNDISSEQAATTEHTLQKCYRLLDFAATHPAAFVRFYASDMILHIDSDAAYLVKPKARSRVAGFSIWIILHHAVYHASMGPSSSSVKHCVTLLHQRPKQKQAESSTMLKWESIFDTC